jgi:hypothetical protein
VRCRAAPAAAFLRSTAELPCSSRVLPYSRFGRIVTCSTFRFNKRTHKVGRQTAAPSASMRHSVQGCLPVVASCRLCWLLSVAAWHAPQAYQLPTCPLPCWQHFARVKFASAHQAARVLAELPHPKVIFAPARPSLLGASHARGRLALAIDACVLGRPLQQCVACLVVQRACSTPAVA